MRFLGIVSFAALALVSTEAMASQSKAIPPEMIESAQKTAAPASNPKPITIAAKAVIQKKVVPAKPAAPVVAPASYANLSVAVPPSDEYFAPDIKQVARPRFLARADENEDFEEDSTENSYIKKEPRVRSASLDRSYMDGDLRCVAQAVYHEARGEPLSGQKAVADVVMNRAKSGKWGSSPCSVVNAPYQFTNRSSWKYPRPGVPDWDRAIAIAKEALSGAIGVSSRALNFRAKYMGAGGPNAFKIGNHVFW